MGKIRIIVAGSRGFSDKEIASVVITGLLSKHVFSKGFKREDVEFVCGMAKGADIIGKEYAERYGYEVKCFPANWDLYGKSAGAIRNKEMAKYASYKKGYGALFAFWDGYSRGTKNMIDIAKECGIRIFVYNYTTNKLINY